MAMETITRVPGEELSFVVDLVRKRITAAFMVNFVDPRSQGDNRFLSKSGIKDLERKNKFMFQIPFAQLKAIQRVELGNSMMALVIALESPPSFFRKREDIEASHSSENMMWSDFDSWYRQTDIVFDPYRLQTAIVALHKDKLVIDIGMCLITWIRWLALTDYHRSMDDISICFQSRQGKRGPLRDYEKRSE